MAIKSVTKKGQSAQKAVSRKTGAGESPAVRNQQPAPDKGEDRAKVLAERFCPEGIAYLKDVLGIDLNSPRVPLSAVYDIAAGRITSEPLEAVVKPLAFDKGKGRLVEMEPIKVVASFLIRLPYDRETRKPVAPDAAGDRQVFVASYPCYEYLQKAEPSQASVTAPAKESSRSEELPTFTPEQVRALEGVGINPDRLYATSFNAVSLQDKRAMLAGEVFEVNGAVRVADIANTNEKGHSELHINVSGRARMVTDKDGGVKTKFEPLYPVERKSNEIIDLMKVFRVGSVELDFFERDAKGKRKTDVYGNPLINQAGKDLARYGVAFGGVSGKVFSKSYNEKSHAWETSYRTEKFQVCVVNGGLAIQKMEKVPELDENGNQKIVNINGKEQEKFHYEVRNCNVSADGIIRVGNQDLKPASGKDLENYRRGVGGKFLGYEYVDYADKNRKKTVCDVYVVPDLRRGGFGKAFSPKVSAELFERQNNAEKKKVTRKQNFSLGI